MANICENTISVMGLKESPDTFIKALSKAMFNVDLDAMDLALWFDRQGEDSKFYETSTVLDVETGFERVLREEIDGKTWYAKLVKAFPHHVRYGVLYSDKSSERYGVRVPRFYVECKWRPVLDEICKASEIYPELTFHVAWFLAGC